MQTNIKEKKKIDLCSGSVPKLLFKMAMPAVIAQIVNMLYNIVDRMYVGGIPEVGMSALAGLGICFPILLIVSAFSALVGTGGAPLASIKLGEKKHEDAERIFNTSLLLLLVVGAILTVFLIIFSKDLLIMFGAPSESLPYGQSYLNIYSIGTVFVMISLGLNGFINAQGRALTGMLTVLIGAVTNIALDPLFIFVFDMGVAGAALATIISQFVSCVWVLVFFFKRSSLKIRPKYFKINFKVVFSILAIGIAPFVMQATESAVQIVFNTQIYQYTGGSTNHTAALTVMLSVMQMLVLPLNGLGSGAQPLIGQNYGAGNMDRVKQAVKYLIICSFCVTLVVWLLCLLAPTMFAAIFSSTPAVAAIVKQYMPMFMMGTLLFAFQFGFQNAFMALGQAGISLFLALLRKVFLLIPLAFIFPLFMGVGGIFLSEGVTDIAAAIVTTLAFLLSIKKILRKRTQLLSENTTKQDSDLGQSDTLPPQLAESEE